MESVLFLNREEGALWNSVCMQLVCSQKGVRSHSQIFSLKATLAYRSELSVSLNLSFQCWEVCTVCLEVNTESKVSE